MRRCRKHSVRIVGVTLGVFEVFSVHWCARCGAVKRKYDKKWTYPNQQKPAKAEGEE